MKIAVSRHVFGSIRGYTTLAKSEDLSGEEIAKLEILSFGQTNESSYFGSLRTNPAYVSRPLHSGRWAVTRVFQGGPDDHNRTTLLFVSAIITMDYWLHSLKCDVDKLLYCPNLWKWNGEEKLKPLEITIEDTREAPGTEMRSKVLSLLAAVEKYIVEENNTVLVRASDFDAKVLRCLNMVLPVASKRVFSCAVRSLNDGLPVDLIIMAEEGSLGNSKRRIVKWTPTSIVGNAPYTNAISQFWQPGGNPPWKFIDSCKSFLVDVGGEPEPEPRKRLVMRKPLYAEVAKPRIARKTYFSRKLAVALFVCAVLAYLATVITIGAMRAKANKEEVVLLIKEAQNFLSQNSPENSPDKCFPVNEIVREQTIEKCEDLRRRVEVLLAKANDPELKETNLALNKFLNSLEDAHQRYGLLDSLFEQVRRHYLRKSPSVYLAPEKIERVDDLKEGIANIDKANLAPNYVSQAKETLQGINRWRNGIGNLVERKKDEVKKITQSAVLQTQPENYSDKQYEEYNDFKQKLESFKEDESLKNAKDSPIKPHQEIAVEVINELDKAVENCGSMLQKMNGFKKDAETSFDDANDIIKDPNVTDGRVENFDRLLTANFLLNAAKKRWLDMPNLEEREEELSGKFERNRGNTLKSWEEEIDKIDRERMPDDPNTAKINELLKDYNTVKTKLQKANIQNIGDILQEIKDYEEKLREKVASFLKSKQQGGRASPVK